MKMRKNQGTVLPLIRQGTTTLCSRFGYHGTLLGIVGNTKLFSTFSTSSRAYTNTTRIKSQISRTKDIISDISNRFYSSISSHFFGYWERLRCSIDSVRWKD